MLVKARRNAEKGNITNVEFVYSKISQMDLPDASADVIISNCVVNLVPDPEKPLVFKEIHRLLKPGGRVAISDILTKKELTEQMKKDVALYVGCVAGASMKEDYEKWLKEAGFDDVLVVDAGSDLNVYVQADGGETVGSMCCGPVQEEGGSGCCGASGKKQDGSECCGAGKKQDGGVVEDIKTNFKDVNLNEWAGKCDPP